MTKRKQLSAAKRELELLELLPKDVAAKRADDLLRAMLNSPPDPFTPKPKKVRKRRASR